jgi:hypothetical protein
MKQISVVLLFLFFAAFLWAQNPVPGPDTPASWTYSIEFYNMEYYGCYPISGIALPSTLVPGAYARFVDGDTQGNTSVEIYDDKGLICYGSSNTIQPDLINGAVNGNLIPDKVKAPCYYPYKIHFYVEMDVEYPEQLARINIPASQITWSPPLDVHILKSTGNLLDYRDNSTPLIHTLDITSSIEQKTITVKAEFDLQPGSYAIISGGNYQYLWSYQNQITYSGRVSTDELRIFFSLDADSPSNPDNIGVQNGYTGNDNIIYTKENKTQEITYKDGTTTAKSGGVTVSWPAAADNGTAVHGCSGTTKSGTAGYYICERQSGGTYPDNPVRITNSSVFGENDAGTNVTGVIPLGEGPHDLAVRAFDKAGNISGYSPVCHVIVDRTPPQLDETAFLFPDHVVTIAGNNFTGKTFDLKWGMVEDASSGTSSYDIELINDTLQTSKIFIVKIGDLVDPSHPQITVHDAQSGKYRVKLRAADNVGNISEWGSEHTFFVDASKPPAPELESFTISDPAAGKETDSSGVTFITINRHVTIGFNPSDDGTEEWQSGISHCLVVSGKDGSEFPVTQGSGTVSAELSGLGTGDNSFRVTAIDNTGNSSDEAKVTLKVVELPAVTFPVPCYTLDNGIYILRWNAPASVPPDAQIAYYKAIVKTQAVVPTADEFEAASMTAGTSLELLPETPQGTEIYAYVLAADTLGNRSFPAAKAFKLPPLTIEEGEPYTLTEDEYWWSGVHEMHASVIVPENVKLTVLPGTVVRTYGSVRLIVYGTLIVQGTEDQPIRFTADSLSTTAWQGIYIKGSALVENAIIEYAFRGITAAAGADVVINRCRFNDDRVGLHAYGAEAVVNNTRFERCEWYGVKEDAVKENNGKRPRLTGCSFRQNGFDYYQEDVRDITIDALNLLPGNSGNIKE